jgi:PAS domain S-box-containing protein
VAETPAGSTGEGIAPPGARRELRVVLDSIKGYGIFMLDPDGRVVTWSAGAAALKGYSEREILGQPVSRFYTPEDRAAERPQRLLATAAREGRVEDEGWRVRKDGSRFWADVVISAIREPGGELRGFVKVTRDLTERKRAEVTFAARAAQQAAVADLGLEAIRIHELQPVLDRAVALVAATLDVDLAAVFELSDEGDALALRAGVGFHEAEVGSALIDGPTPAVLAGDPEAPSTLDAFAADERFAASLLDGEGVLSGVRVVVPAIGGGPPFGILGAHARTRRAFTRDDKNFLHAVANVLASAAARTRMDGQLRAAEARAQEERLRNAQALQALRDRDEFIAVAAHELRTPLTVLQLKLQGVQQAARDGRGDEPAQRSRLDAAARQAARLGTLVDRLLDVSRIASGRLELHREELDLRAVVERLVDGAREDGARMGCALVLSAPAPVRGWFDRARLQQVVGNLLTNATKYGAGKPVEVSVEAAGDAARITVRDHGIGISPGAQRRIFDRFERAVSVRHYGGLGLGLYIARHVVEAHGGRIAVESGAGQGASFTVELPLDARQE